MARRPWFILFFLAAMLAAHMAGPFISFAGPPKEIKPVTSCVEEVRIARATNPFKVWDSRGTGPQGTSVRAADLKGGDYEVIPSLARYTASGQMLMGIDRKTHEPVVSSRYFSPLARVDATRIEPGQKKEIGTFFGASSSTLKFRDVVLFLLESQVVTTYWHVESILCLVSEDNSTELYRAYFRGKHIYYTNRYNEEKLDFVLGIEKASDRMFLLGGR
jgi:hypothetical protein